MRSLRPGLSLGLLAALCIASGCQSTALTSAKLYLQEDEPERAKQQLLAAAESTPDDPEVHFLLGRVYGLEGDWVAMAAALDRSGALSTRFAPDIAQVRRYYWTQNYNAGVTAATAAEPDHAAASQAFAAATVIDPTEVSGWRNLAFTHYVLGASDEAIGAYRQALMVAPQDTLVLSGLSTLLVQEGRYEEAATALRELVKLAPGDAAAFVNLGIACERLQDEAAAEDAFRQALLIDPDMALAHYGLGNLYWGQGLYEQAGAAYQKAVSEDPEDVDARFNLAMVHLRLENDAAALPLLQRLSEQVPDNGAVWRQLSLVYARQDNVELAKAADAKAKALGF